MTLRELYFTSSEATGDNTSNQQADTSEKGVSREPGRVLRNTVQAP